MPRVPVAVTLLLLLLFLLPAGVRAGEDANDGEDPLLDQLIDRAIDARGELRERLVAQLAERGGPAVRRLLARLERASLPEAVIRAANPQVVVLVAIRLIEAPIGSTARLFGDARPEGLHVLERDEAVVLLQAVKDDPAIRVLNAPRLLIADREWATVNTTTPLTYLKEYRVERAPGAAIAEPVIGRIEEGLVVEVRPVVSADGKYVTLEGSLKHTGVVRPIRTRTQRLEGIDEPVLIEMPETHADRLDLHVTVPNGAYVAGLGLPHPTEDARELIVLVQADLVDGERELQPTTREVVAATPQVPDEGPFLEIEARVVELEKDRLEALLGSHAPTVDVPARVLPDALARRLTEAEDVKVLSAPKLTTYDGQKANVSVLNQISYVRDYEVRKGTDGSTVADPVIEVIQEGLVLDVLGTILDGGTTLEVRMSHAEVQRPIPELRTMSGGQEVRVQVPELTVSRVKATVDVPDGGTVVVGGLGVGDLGHRIALLRVRHVTLE